jgi:hypothetical protein
MLDQTAKWKVYPDTKSTDTYYRSEGETYTHDPLNTSNLLKKHNIFPVILCGIALRGWQVKLLGPLGKSIFYQPTTSYWQQYSYHIAATLQAFTRHS